MRVPLIIAALSCSTVCIAMLSSKAEAQSMMDQIVYNKCSAAMSADYQQAGKTPPAGLVDNMCQCVVKQMTQLHSIEAAKTVCIAQVGTGGN